MRISFITPYFAPAWSYGGPPRVIYLLARQLVRLGHTVTVFTTDSLGEKRNALLSEEMEGITVKRYKTISNALAYNQKIFYISSFLEKIKKEITKSDRVLFSDLRTFLNWQVYGYLVKKKIPYGIFPFGQIPYDAGWKRIPKTFFDKWWVKDFVEKASWRFAQTEHEQEMYTELFDIPIEKTHLHFLPVETQSRSILRNKRIELMEKYGITEEDKILLFVGRLHYLKGIDILIRNLIPLLSKQKKWKLFIVGRDDGCEDELKSLIPVQLQKQIIFTGPLYGDGVTHIYSLASCYIMTPRYFEETSTAALEALSIGVPVVTTREAQIPFLDSYKAGFTLEKDLSNIHLKVKTLLSANKKNTGLYKSQARKLVEEKFEISAITQRLLTYIV